MTLDEIMNLDAEDIIRLKKEDPAQLRRITSRLASTARKRIDRTKGLTIVPPAVSGIQRTGGIQSIRGKNIQQVTAEFQRLKGFLGNPQSTIKGARQFAKETAANLGVTDLTEKQVGRLLDVWGRLKERYPDITGIQHNYDKLLDFLHDEVKGDNVPIEVLMEQAEQYIREMYESQEVTGGGTSEFFTIDDN